MAELPEFIQALLNPKAYPTPPQKIELAQTQMSFVFIAGDYVYKAKKPVNNLLQMLRVGCGLPMIIVRGRS